MVPRICSCVLVITMSIFVVAAVISLNLDETIEDVTNYDRVFTEVPRYTRHIPSVLTEITGPLSRSKRQIADSEYIRSDLVYSRMRVLHLMMKYLIGPNGPEIEIRHFVNWDKTILIDNLFYVRPTTIQQVQRIIRVAAMMHMRVRATGKGHSRSPLYPDEGNIMMDVRDLTRFDGPRIELMRPSSERNYLTVKVMTGVYLYELNAFLVKNGVTVMAEPLENNDTIGGMVSVSTHGSSWNGTGFGDNIVEVRLIDSLGRLRRFVREKHTELFKALTCGLGMFGIMYDITIKVVPTKVVKVENQIVPLGSLIYNSTKFGETVSSNLATEISWYPFNSVNDTEAQNYINSGNIPADWSARKDYLWLRTVNEVDDINPSLIQGPNFLPTGGSLSGSNVTGLLRGKAALDLARSLAPVTYHYLPDAFALLKPPRFGSETSTAFMVTVDTEYKRPLAALQFIIEFAERQIRENGTTPVNALLPRLVMNSDCHICPANSNIQPVNSTGRSMVIDFLAPPLQDGYYDISRKFVYKFRGDLVRPHWAKRYDNIPGVMDIIRDVYGEGIHKFMKSREDYRLDPCDLFMNKFLQQIFGDSKICY
ncbi:hypothetical protein CHS0354_022658 [Potamilus streckersoni]|uniref:FAD-binding PCMH-type domain-containing protein n=1 Tax=Potamilus streckersoni TaxID=2493646 RepID=A0AAE0WCP1_9BIVA|nr:hypothetical protein CHS0354_022658 [Potamilus streckersoni]